MTKNKHKNPHRVAWARDYWEKVVESEKGLRLFFDTRTQAIAARFDFYTARNINREEMKEFYAEGSPEWGSSPWDPFRLTIQLDDKTNKWALLITRHSDPTNAPSHVEEI